MCWHKKKFVFEQVKISNSSDAHARTMANNLLHKAIPYNI